MLLTQAAPSREWLRIRNAKPPAQGCYTTQSKDDKESRSEQGRQGVPSEMVQLVAERLPALRWTAGLERAAAAQDLHDLVVRAALAYLARPQYPAGGVRCGPLHLARERVMDLGPEAAPATRRGLSERACAEAWPVLAQRADQRVEAAATPGAGP